MSDKMKSCDHQKPNKYQAKQHQRTQSNPNTPKHPKLPNQSENHT